MSWNLSCSSSSPSVWNRTSDDQLYDPAAKEGSERFRPSSLGLNSLTTVEQLEFMKTWSVWAKGLGTVQSWLSWAGLSSVPAYVDDLIGDAAVFLRTRRRTLIDSPRDQQLQRDQTKKVSPSLNGSMEMDELTLDPAKSTLETLPKRVTVFPSVGVRW